MFSTFNCSFTYHVCSKGSSFLTSKLTSQDQLKGFLILLGLESISATRINNFFWMKIQPPKSMCNCESSLQNLSPSTCHLYATCLTNHTPSKLQNMNGKSAKAAINHQIFLYALFMSRFDISIHRLIFLIVLQHSKKKNLRFYDFYLHKTVKEWNKET